jgi:asparagine synthase (glutamine-hydrolysing)
MCGICGVFGHRDQVGKGEQQTVEAMKRILRHRGPDGEGTFTSESGVLGHRRLAIIDIENGQQPMVSVDGQYVLVFNGEIYNYLELRSELKAKGVEFKTNSDTEVLLQLLVQEGESCLEKLNGMFAFAFHNTVSGSWLVARDQFGIKPFYYTQTRGGQFLFASEIKALLAHPSVKPQVNPNGINHYLTFQFCLGEETLFHGISSLEPGYYLVGRAGSIEQKVRYWDTNFNVDEDSREEDFVLRLEELLKDSARLQIRSDVPVGCHLSGGLDSSSVACLASKYLGLEISTFTGKFAEGPEFDESQYARIVAEQIEAQMHEIIPTAQNFVDYLPGIIKSLDEPVAGPGVFPQYMVSRLARENVKVALGGQGGDEIFGGYARYLLGYLEQAMKGAIHENQEEGKHVVSLESIIPNLPLLREYVPLMKNFWRKGLFEDMTSRYFRLVDRSPGFENLLTQEALVKFNREQAYNDFGTLFNHPETKSYINKMTHFDLKTLLPALLQVEDRVSMAVSLESRVPLLDTRIVNLVTSAPPTIKFAGGRTKALLKKAMHGLVPQSIINRKDKMGFPVPLKHWLKKGPVRDFINDTFLSQPCRERGLYKRKELKKMVDKPGVAGRSLWGALSLEIWHQTYMDG